MFFRNRSTTGTNSKGLILLRSSAVSRCCTTPRHLQGYDELREGIPYDGTEVMPSDSIHSETSDRRLASGEPGT